MAVKLYNNKRKWKLFFYTVVNRNETKLTVSRKNAKILAVNRIA